MDMSDVVSTDAGYREAAGTTPLRHAQFDDPVSAADPRECKIAPTTELNNRANFPFIVFFL
jgi:hypothetical protein